MVGQEEMAKNLRLAVVSGKEGRKEAAVVSEVAMDALELAKEVVVLTSLETR